MHNFSIFSSFPHSYESQRVCVCVSVLFRYLFVCFSSFVPLFQFFHGSTLLYLYVYLFFWGILTQNSHSRMQGGKRCGLCSWQTFFFTFIFGLLPFHAVLTSTQPLAAESCQNQFHSTGIMMIRLRTKGKRRGNWEGWNGERRSRLIDFRNRGPST